MAYLITTLKVLPELIYEMNKIATNMKADKK